MKIPRSNSGMARKIYNVLMSLLIVFQLAAAPIALAEGPHIKGISDFPLIHATHHDNLAEVKRLIAMDANLLNTKNNQGTTALMNAAWRGRSEIAKTLLDAGADVNMANNDGHTALLEATRAGHVKLAQMLLDAGATNKEGSNVRLIIAAYSENLSQVKKLIAEGESVNASDIYGRTALMSAANHGHHKAAKILLDVGADVNAKNIHGETALMSAAYKGHAKIAKMLLDAGANVSLITKLGWTAMKAASGHADVTKMLLDAGADVNATDTYGQTALMEATENVQVVKVLIGAGANVNAKNNSGDTALMFAAKFYDAQDEILNALINAGAHVNVKNDDGETALMFAWINWYRNPKIVKILLDAGANVNATDTYEQTALMQAAVIMFSKNKGQDLAKVLLDAGANIEITDYKGKTALDYASPEIASFMKEHRQKQKQELEQEIIATSCPEIKADTSLPPEVYADRKMIEAERKFHENNYLAAAKIMKFVRCYSEANNVTLPKDFDFQNAKILMHAKLNKAAKAAITRYLKEVGRDGEDYKEALQIFDHLEQQ